MSWRTLPPSSRSASVSPERLALFQTLVNPAFPDRRVRFVERFPGRGENEVYRVFLSDGPPSSVVVKVFRRAAGAELARLCCLREVAAREALRKIHLPVPALHGFYAYEGTNEAFDYLILEYVDADPVGPNFSFLSSDRLWRVGFQLGEWLRQMHAIRFDRVGEAVGSELLAASEWGWAPSLAGLYAGAVERHLGKLPDELRLQVESVFVRRMPLVERCEASAGVLIHGGLDPGNLLVVTHDRERPLRALIDFDEALLLCPEAELGILHHRWAVGASAERHGAYRSLREGLLEAYQPQRLGEDWEERACAFALLEALRGWETLSNREYLLRIAGGGSGG
ncbi:MAG: hypothetical protein KatS3mg115_0087 [Candidatus Poribacteria bacterium]|nr:MAG: hypothetical protein KatS3mg115_0087 [Candidatus Poribacteria bacterium]